MIINTNSDLFKLPETSHILPTVEDALSFGVDLIWSDSLEVVHLENINIIKTNIRLKTKVNHSLYLIPLKEGILPQLIQTDWWIKPIDIYSNKDCNFINGEPIAKAIIVLRENYIIKKMSPDIIKDLNNKEEFVNSQEYATRKDVYGDNTYQVLKHRAERNNLPVELQPIVKPNPRLRIV